MQTVIWTPPPGPLFALSELATDVAYAVTCSVVDETDPTLAVVGYQAIVTPEQSLLTVTAGSSGVTVSADSLSGLFSIEFIDYLRGGQLARASSWEELPEDAEELVEFRPSREVSKVYLLTVTALLSDNTELVAEYTMTVFQDWTAGRNRLVEEVNARR